MVEKIGDLEDRIEDVEAKAYADYDAGDRYTQPWLDSMKWHLDMRLKEFAGLIDEVEQFSVSRNMGLHGGGKMEIKPAANGELKFRLISEDDNSEDIETVVQKILWVREIRRQRYNKEEV